MDRTMSKVRHILTASLILICLCSAVLFGHALSQGLIYVAAPIERKPSPWSDTDNPASDYDANTAKARRGIIDPRTGMRAAAASGTLGEDADDAWNEPR
jgi:hypothetical protein